MRISTQKLAFLACSLLVVVAVGCDTTPDIRYDKLDLVKASGTVTLDGAPLPNAVVVFEDENGRFSYALTDADGRYALQFDANMSGVTPGEKTVRISTTRKILGLNTSDDGEAPPGEASTEGEQAPQQLELVPARYNKESELTRTVEQNGDQTFDFDLESDPQAE